jgi:hypothetical protein
MNLDENLSLEEKCSEREDGDEKSSFQFWFRHAILLSHELMPLHGTVW